MSLVALKTNMSSIDLVEIFLSNKLGATRDAYKQDLVCFQSFLKFKFEIKSLQDLVSLTNGELNMAVLNYCDYLHSKNLSPATINRRLGAIRSLFKLARLISFSAHKIEIQNIKSDSYRDTKGPGLPAFKRMLKIASGQDKSKAARDLAILRLLFDLALRASELVSLDLCHIDFEQNRISIKGKGRNQREFLTLPITSINALKAWLDIRGLDPGPLFYNLSRSSDSKKRLTRTGLFKLVKMLDHKADVKTRPHGLRHLSITEACKVAQNNGFALEEVMDHSRHKSISTLMIYRDRERDTQGAISTLVSNTILEGK